MGRIIPSDVVRCPYLRGCLCNGHVSTGTVERSCVILIHGHHSVNRVHCIHIVHCSPCVTFAAVVDTFITMVTKIIQVKMA